MKLSKIGLFLASAIALSLAVGCAAESTEPQQDEKSVTPAEELPTLESKIEPAACPPAGTCQKMCSLCKMPRTTPTQCSICSQCATCNLH